VRVDFTQHSHHLPPSIRVHRQEVDDVGPVLTVLTGRPLPNGGHSETPRIGGQVWLSSEGSDTARRTSAGSARNTRRERPRPAEATFLSERGCADRGQVALRLRPPPSDPRRT
jgi:hypothetical protein